MAQLNEVQTKINTLSAGEFQILFDRYLSKKYKWNLVPLGTQSGTNKTTKGTPDSYVKLENGNYIFANYGSYSSSKVDKIKADIKSSLDENKTHISNSKIEKIICGYLGSNLTPFEIEEICSAYKEYNIELISSDTVAFDLIDKYPYIISELLSPLKMGSDQLFDIDSFIKRYDSLKMSAPLDIEFKFRDNEKEQIIDSLNNQKAVIITGTPGLGKTRLALEVCRYFENNDYNVYCVRNNNQPLFDDIRSYANNENTLIFFDDVNEATDIFSIFQYLLEQDKSKRPKILCTVRDYAKDIIISKINILTDYEQFSLKTFTHENIETLLKEKYNIQNQMYLDRINEIAKGNPRLAILAGKKAVSGGFKELYDAASIFESIFEDILTSSSLNKDDILFLFILSVTGGVQYSDNSFYQSLKNDYIPNLNEVDTINKLRLFEMIDCFREKIIKITDQSFRDYIIFYVLFKEKMINITGFIDKYFSEHSQAIATTIAILCNVFKTKVLIDYVEKEVIESWNRIPKEEELHFIKIFGHFNESRALLRIKKELDTSIKNREKISASLLTKKESTNIRNEYIQMLTEYTTGENSFTSYQMVINIFQSDPNKYFWDTYNFLIEHSIFCIDEYNGLIIHLDQLSNLYNKCEHGKNNNFTILYLKVSAYIFQNEFTFARQIHKRSVRFGRINLELNESLINARYIILSSYKELFNNDIHKKYILDTLMSVDYSCFKNQESASFVLKKEFEIIYSFINDLVETDFPVAQLLHHFEKEALELNMTLNTTTSSLDNTDFRVYKKLKCLEGLWRASEKEQIEKKNSIIVKTFGSYKLDDYNHLFHKIKEFHENGILKSDGDYYISECIKAIFEYLEDDFALYKNVLIAYWNASINEFNRNYDVINFLLNRLGYSETLSFIKTYNKTTQNNWMADLYLLLDSEEINVEVATDFKSFMRDALHDGTPIIINSSDIYKYWIYDKNIILIVNSIIDKHPNLIKPFIKFGMNEKDAEKIIEMYSNDIATLKKNYLLSLFLEADYDWTLFWRIYELDNSIWKEAIPTILGNIKKEKFTDELFESMWEKEDWQSLVNFAFEYLYKTDELIHYGSANVLFKNHYNDSNEILDKKKNWFILQIQNYSSNKRRTCVILQVMASTYPYWRKEILLSIITPNTSVEDFETLLHCSFTFSQSWSGSEIPLINNKINELLELKDALNKTVEYLPFKQVIEDKIRILQSYKENTELKEYLDPYID